MKHKAREAISRAELCEWALRTWGTKMYEVPGFPRTQKIQPVGIPPMDGVGGDLSVVNWHPDDPVWLRRNYRKLVAKQAADKAEIDHLRKLLAQAERKIAAVEQQRAEHSKKMSEAGRKGGRGNTSW